MWLHDLVSSGHVRASSVGGLLDGMEATSAAVGVGVGECGFF